MSHLDSFADRVGTAVTVRSQRGESAGEPPRSQDWATVGAAARCWAQSGDGFFPVTEVVEKLPPGAYRCRDSNRGPYLEKMPIEIDSLLHLPDSAGEQLLAEFKKFWTLRDNFARHGFTFKRGMLLWGPPGSGKTSAIWQMTQTLVNDQSGIVLFIEAPDLSALCLSLVRRIEPARPLICVYEDIDALIDATASTASSPCWTAKPRPTRWCMSPPPIIRKSWTSGLSIAHPASTPSC
jgi:hypothetical protein